MRAERILCPFIYLLSKTDIPIFCKALQKFVNCVSLPVFTERQEAPIATRLCRGIVCRGIED